MTEEFFLERSINPNRLYELKWFELGKLPFDLVYPEAVRIENFWVQDEFDHLPYRFLIFYQESVENRQSIIWRCHLCGFWCDIFDQRLMEKHLCNLCDVIPESDRLKLKNYVLEQALEQIGHFLNES